MLQDLQKPHLKTNTKFNEAVTLAKASLRHLLHCLTRFLRLRTTLCKLGSVCSVNGVLRKNRLCAHLLDRGLLETQWLYACEAQVRRDRA